MQAYLQGGENPKELYRLTTINIHLTTIFKTSETLMYWGPLLQAAKGEEGEITFFTKKKFCLKPALLTIGLQHPITTLPKAFYNCQGIVNILYLCGHGYYILLYNALFCITFYKSNKINSTFTSVNDPEKQTHESLGLQSQQPGLESYFLSLLIENIR